MPGVADESLRFLNMTNNSSRHRPPHIYKKDAFYFITSKTYKSNPYFSTNEDKELLTNVIKTTKKKFDIYIYAWVILSNHYHLLLQTKDKNISAFIQNIHANSSRLLKARRLSPATPEKIWYQYFDRCIRSEKDFWTRFNYIHNNPIKHGYIKNPDVLHLYKFSSYNQWLGKKGKEWMVSCFAQYPIIDFTCEDNWE